MMSPKPTRTTRRAGCPSPAARPPRAAWFSILLAALVCSLLLATACKRTDPTPTPKPAPVKQAKVDEAPTKEELEKIAREREAFGLPLPPDAVHIHRTDAYVTAYSYMKLAEIEAFYKSRLIDYEFIYPDAQNQPNRPPRELHIIGLRTFMAQVTIRHTGGKNGTAVLDFRPPSQPVVTPEIAQNPASNQPDNPDNIAPVERRREKGMPVLDRNAKGELIAPGARWGEPYTPPKGTPLHTKRNSENFGQPYGEWQMP